MNTELLEALAAIRQSVLTDWERQWRSPQRHEYDYLRSATDKVERILSETLTKLYDVYGPKFIVLQAFMQLEGLLSMELADILPARGEYNHLCMHELLHILLLNYIMDDLEAVGEDRGYFSANDGGVGDNQGTKTGPRHH